MGKKVVMSTRLVFSGIMAPSSLLFLIGKRDAKNGLERTGVDELSRKVEIRLSSEVIKLSRFVEKKIIQAHQAKATLEKMQTDIMIGELNKARAAGTISKLIASLMDLEAEIKRNEAISVSRRDKVRAKALKKIAAYIKGVVSINHSEFKVSDNIPETLAETTQKEQLAAFYKSIEAVYDYQVTDTSFMKEV